MFSLSRHVVQTRSPASAASFILRSCPRPIVQSCNTQQQTRTYSVPPRSSLTPTHSIYISRSTDPYFNLTLEDWLFRHHPPETPLLLLYRNAPCVVIGRHQNPWKEVNLASAKTRRIPWIRRRSGGGTVYHDLGNTNYSIHIPRAKFDRTTTANVVLRAVRSLGVDAYVNERHDICVSGEKVSGSAYKIMSNRAYHHGTMLISTNIHTLGDLLQSNKETMHTKGVESVRSPVRNLKKSSAAVTHNAFVDAVVKSFREEYDFHQEVCYVGATPEYTKDQYFRAGMSELRSWEWAYGQTPEFEYVVSKSFKWGDVTATIRSRWGLILSCSFSLSPHPDIHVSTNPALDNMQVCLIGERYAFVEDSAVFPDVNMRKAQGIGEVWGWLKGVMDT